MAKRKTILPQITAACCIVTLVVLSHQWIFYKVVLFFDTFLLSCSEDDIVSWDLNAF